MGLDQGAIGWSTGRGLIDWRRDERGENRENRKLS